jgi:hypothetical protein
MAKERTKSEHIVAILSCGYKLSHREQNRNEDLYQAREE